MKKELILAGLASLMFASCSNDKDLPAVSQGSELGVNTRIFGSGSTRALTDAFVQNNQIGVFIKGTDYVPHLAAYTCPLDPTGVWTSPAADADKIYLANVEATVYAFYPYAAGAITNSSDDTQGDYYTAIDVTIPPTQQFDGADVADYMYATTREGDGSGTPAYNYPLAKASNADADDDAATPAVYDNKVDLYMHHALSKLSFVVNKDVTYVGTGTLSQLTLATAAPVAGTPKFQTGALTMSVSDGVISGAPASDLLTVTGPSDLTINAYNATPSTVVTTAALVAPLADTSGITLTLTIDGKDMSVALPSDALNSSDKWLDEKNYTYTITVKGTELIVNSVSIVAWGDVAAGSADVQ
ncbi:fimbrillin family protein [uncultured Bacteroides sp.]|uniref:fimbrillin family protein n=1 Tax=uncultured Bacteroides sp. TaxID=162156 RepID=UPI002AAA96BB|nr:fimbrillin family protein [uncultured Bacteroides sp.]